MRKMEPWHESSAVYESEWIGFLFICISMYAFVIQGKFIKKRMKEKYSEVEDAEDPMVLLWIDSVSYCDGLLVQGLCFPFVWKLSLVRGS